MLAFREGVRLEEVEFVAGSHEGQFVEGVDGLSLIGLQLGQLVKGTACLFNLGLQVG